MYEEHRLWGFSVILAMRKKRLFSSNWTSSSLKAFHPPIIPQLQPNNLFLGSETLVRPNGAYVESHQGHKDYDKWVGTT